MTEIVGGDDKAYLSNDTHTEVLPTATSHKNEQPRTVQDDADKGIDQVPGGGISLKASLGIKHGEPQVSAMSTNYIVPSAHTVTITSSTTACMGAEADDRLQSNGPIGIRPGFGLTSIPILEIPILSVFTTIAWIAVWEYL